MESFNGGIGVLILLFVPSLWIIARDIYDTRQDYLERSSEGKKILEYIKSITTEAVAGPNIDSNKLFHLEGMRFLTAVIQTRIKKGEKDGR